MLATPDAAVPIMARCCSLVLRFTRPSTFTPCRGHSLPYDTTGCFDYVGMASFVLF